MVQIEQKNIILIEIPPKEKKEQKLKKSSSYKKKKLIEAIEDSKFNNKYHKDKISLNQAKQANWAKYGDFYMNI